MKQVIVVLFSVLVISGCFEDINENGQELLEEHARSTLKSNIFEGVVTNVGLSIDANDRRYQIITLDNEHKFIVKPEIDLVFVKGLKVQLLLDISGPFDYIDPVVASLYSDAYVVELVKKYSFD